MIAKKYGFTARKVILIHSLSYYSKTHDKLQEFICKLHKKKPTKKRLLFCRRIRLFESSKSREKFPAGNAGNCRRGRRKKHTQCAVPAGTNFLQSGKFQKDLILFVVRCYLGVLLRGWENLEAPGKGVRIGTFCGVQKVPQKHAEGCDPLDSRGRFKALPEKILAKFSDGTSRTRLFAQNGGEKALNRCEVRVLQRKELERIAKE